MSKSILITSEIGFKEPELIYLALIVASLVLLVAIIVISSDNLIVKFVATVIIASNIYISHNIMSKTLSFYIKFLVFKFYFHFFLSVYSLFSI